MKRGYLRTLAGVAAVGAILVLLVVAGACSSGNDETVDLLKDPKFGLAHLNAEFHTVKGEDLLASPAFGLAHLNDEFHTIKQMLSELSQRLESLAQEVQ